jgi:hypothetical protein
VLIFLILFSSPPPEVEMQEHRRSRRDMSPQGRKRAAVMMSRDKMVSYQPQRKVSGPSPPVMCVVVARLHHFKLTVLVNTESIEPKGVHV